MNSVLSAHIRVPRHFYLPLLAILLVSAGSFLSLGLISEQKLRYALFQRDLLTLEARWGGLVRSTALLPISGHTASAAYKDGLNQMAEVRQLVAKMEHTLQQASWLEPGIQSDLQMLYQGFTRGVNELELPYADLQEFVAHNTSQNNTALLRKTMSELIRQTWRDDAAFDRDHLFLLVRMYGNIARLDSNFSTLLDTRVSKIRGQLDTMVEDRFRWYSMGQTALGTSLILLVIFLMRRLSDLYKESIASKEAMTDLSMRDILTDLPNRRSLANLLPHLVERTKQRGIGFCVMLLDVDNFKGINDTLGHAAGDFLLKALAERMNGLLRKPAVVARLGGDEFVLLLPETFQVSDAEAVARRLLAHVSKPIALDGQSLQFTISIGIAQCPPHGDSLEALLHSADLAMYQAKKGGKNNYALYSQTLESA